MTVLFREQPWDLFFVMAYAAVAAALLIFLGVGFVGLTLLLFAPGYVLFAAIFPGQGEASWAERIALSFGMSIALVPLMGLVLNFTPFGIGARSVIATVTSFTIIVGLVAYWRRMRLAAPNRLSLTIAFVFRDWNSRNLLDKGLTLGVIVSIAVAGATLAYMIAIPAPSEPFTEFYISGTGANTSGYPSHLNVSERGNVVLGLANHEGAVVSYAVRVDLSGVRLAYNNSGVVIGTVEVNRTTLSWFNITLPNEQSWARPYPFWINSTGSWRMQFLLYKAGVLTNQELHFYVRVS